MQTLNEGMYVSVLAEEMRNLYFNFKFKCKFDDPKILPVKYIYAATYRNGGYYDGVLGVVEKAIAEFDEQGSAVYTFYLSEYLGNGQTVQSNMDVHDMSHGGGFNIKDRTLMATGKAGEPERYRARPAAVAYPLTIKEAIAKLSDTYETKPESITISIVGDSQ
jgi:hypothetical protein